MKNLIFAFTLLLIIGLTGCSEDQTSSDAASTSPLSDYEGTWMESSSTIGQDDNEVIVANDTFYSTSYDDKNIDGVYDVLIKVEIPLKYNGERIVQPNDIQVSKVIMVVGKFILTPLTDDYAIKLNQEKHCGYNDYAVNIAKDISYCGELLHPGEEMRNIFYRDGQKLYFGDERQLSTDGYPEAIDYSSYLVKITPKG